MRRLTLVVAIGATLTGASLARADCAPATRLSTCLDADNLWPHAGPSDFTFMGGTRTIAPGQVGFALVTTYLARPLVLVVPTADIEGAEVPVIDKLWDTTALFSVGLNGFVDLSVALPFTTYRNGTGLSALTGQSSAQLAHTAMRDARLGATFALLPRARGRSPFELASRFEVSLPTGDDASFAGDRSFVGIPSFSAGLREGAFVASAELGARLRRTTELAGSRIGSELVVALGVGADVLDDQRLGFRLEAIALPTFAGQSVLDLQAGSTRRSVVDTRPPLVPAEWQASLRSAHMIDPNLSMSLGGGGALRLTSESGVTTPSVRFTFSICYAPQAD